MEQVAIAHCAIEHAWLVAEEQTTAVWHVRVIALFLGHNVFAIQVFY